MKSGNSTKSNPKPVTSPRADAVRKAEKPDKPTEVTRELTDEEIAAVAGGVSLNFTKIE